MSKFESQSEDGSFEVLVAGMANQDTRTTKAFHVVYAVLPLIQSRGYRQEASETQIYDSRIFKSRCDDLDAKRCGPGELSLRWSMSSR